MPDETIPDEILIEESSSKLRDTVGPLPCVLGIHNWRYPIVTNGLTFSGDQAGDGTWVVESEQTGERVAQYCRSCSKRRERSDLNDGETMERLKAIQRGDREAEYPERVWGDD